MSRERWRRVAKWFEAALRRPAAARRTWLAEECPDADVRAEVEAMLDAHEGADGILDRSLGSLAPRALDSEPTAVEDAGPYRVVREIGRGGMGVVYQAHDPRLDRFVALKFLPPAFDADDEIQARFLTEAKAASTLDHPNICTIYDIGRSAAGRLYIAMAFYEGETLAVRLERGALEIDEAVDVLQQVAQGLARAHEAGIVHRDIKPSNLMLTPRGVVKILDFGVAKLEGGATLTQPGTLVGTPAYMSPEQLGGEEVDQRTDVWSLGVVLYEMLAGRRPFHGDRRTILTAILQREPEPVEMVRPETPEWLAELVRRLLVKSPAHRVEGGGELLAEIGRMRRGTLPPSPVPQRFVPRPRPLPQNLTSFVDRDEEVELVARLLSEARIVTLTGPAGTGKTRLALRVAERMSEAYADGIVFVPLTTVIDASLVIPAVAEALGAPESPSGRTLERLQGILADRELLLILDDFEQVVEAASDVGRLLGACSSLKVLVTSRLPLRLSGEHEFPVRPLAVPDRRRPANLEEALDFPAIQLFRDRARATDPTFRLRADNVNAVAELCARLDGLPLAIELAAVRVKLFSPSELLSRLGARLDLLKGGPRDRPARHQTLRGAIDWSYRLLSDDERKLFRTLAVFVGGCTLDAARRIVEAQSEIAVDILDGIASLVDQNLLRREESPGGETRFGMLETLRDYGLETLEQAGESVSVHRAHAAYYLELAEAAEPELTAARQAAWLDRLDAEHDNLRAAFASAVERGEPETALRLAAALWRFWLARGHLQEASQCIERALSLPAGRASSDAARARALNGLGTVAHNRGENEYARGRLEESLALWRQIGDERGVAAVLNNLGWVACELTDLEAAHELSDEGLALNRKLAETRGIAVALNNLGWVAHYVGDSRTARARHAESLELRRQIADQRGIVFALVNLAWAEQYHGSYDRTFALLDEAAEVVKPLGDRLLDGFVSLIRVIAWYDMGRFEEAVTAVERSWESWQEAGNRSGVAWSLSVHGALVLELGETARAERLLNEALALWRAIGGRWGMGLTQRNLARAALVSGRVDEARSGYQRSLELAHSLGLRLSVAECLEGLAPIHVAGGELERAARLLAAADAERTRLEVPVPPRLTRVLTALRERIRIKLGEEGTQLDSSAGDESSLAEVVAAELDSD